MQDYQYPLDLDWTTEEMVIVMKMWEDLELANEKGIDNARFLKSYQQFKTVIPSIGEEKNQEKNLKKYQVIHCIEQFKQQKRIRKKS